MHDREMCGRAEMLVEIFDGIAWQHLSALSDEERAVVLTKAYARAMLNVLVRAMPDELVKKLLSAPVEGEAHLLRAMHSYPWNDDIRHVMLAHAHRLEEHP